MNLVKKRKECPSWYKTVGLSVKGLRGALNARIHRAASFDAILLDGLDRDRGERAPETFVARADAHAHRVGNRGKTLAAQATLHDLVFALAGE